MIIYTQTPDYYQEYLEHGWLKDQAAKVHKYLERWRGKNGKWYYRYKAAAKNAGYKLKSKATDLYTKWNRLGSWDYLNRPTLNDKIKAYKNKHKNKKYDADPAMVSYNYGKQATNIIDNGKIRAGDYNQKEAARSRTINQTEKAIEAGRQRVKARQEKPGVKYSQNLSGKGYVSSKSGENSNVVKNSSVVKKVNSNTRNSKNKKSLNNKGYHNSKNTYNSKGDSLYNILTGDDGKPAMYDPTTEGGTRRYKSRTEVWRNLSLPEQYYMLYRNNPKKFEQVATPQIREEINKELKKRNKKTI